MIIRSQNKKGIVNLNMIDTIEAYDGQVRYFSGGGIETAGTLGTYSTEEKAIKVLDMIQNKYFEHMTVEKNSAIVGILERPKVFQMPQDSEV